MIDLNERFCVVSAVEFQIMHVHVVSLLQYFISMYVMRMVNENTIEYRYFH